MTDRFLLVGILVALILQLVVLVSFAAIVRSDPTVYCKPRVQAQAGSTYVCSKDVLR